MKLKAERPLKDWNNEIMYISQIVTDLIEMQITNN